jgi:glucokinase
VNADDAGLAIGIDVGGTHLRAALVGPDGLRGEVLRTPSAVSDARALVDSIVAAVHAVMAAAPVALLAGPPTALPVGVGMAGLVDRSGHLLYGPNVAVRDVALAPVLRERLDRRVVVANDASVAVLAEQRLGSAQGHADVVMFTLGTGVGGGAIVAGQLLLGAHGMAAELGHLIIAMGGKVAPSGIPGTLEAYVSGRAVAAAAKERVDPAGGQPLDASDVVAAADAGEGWARSLLEEVGARLGLGIANAAAVLDPSVVVVGGGAGTAMAPWILPATRVALDRSLLGAGLRPALPVLVAALGDDAGVLGAGLLAGECAA